MRASWRDSNPRPYRYQPWRSDIGIVRNGKHKQLEEEADRLIRQSLVGVTKHSAKSDILTPWKEAERYRREVYPASGVADNTRKGMFHRVANSSKPDLNCLSGETEVIVRDQGVKRIEDLEGTTQEVFTRLGWLKGEFRAYGMAPAYPVTLRRYGAIKTVWATSNHRWLAHDQQPGVYLSGARVGLPKPSAHCPKIIKEVFTADLKPGQRLLTKSLPLLIGQTKPSAFGVAHGFTFGDGSRQTSRRGVEGGAYADLFGEKDRCVLPYFPNPRLSYYERPDVSVSTVRIIDLPGFFKDVPDIAESVPYLYGWLAGYFAADGSVDKRGYCRIFSASLSNMRFVRDVCYRLGITTSAQTEVKSKDSWTGADRVCYTVTIDKHSLTEPFFIVDEHRRRFVETMGKRNKVEDWIVQSVGEDTSPREVFCAQVPVAEEFLLGDYLMTGNSRDGSAPPQGRGRTVSIRTHVDEFGQRPEGDD